VKHYLAYVIQVSYAQCPRMYERTQHVLKLESGVKSIP